MVKVAPAVRSAAKPTHTPPAMVQEQPPPDWQDDWRPRHQHRSSLPPSPPMPDLPPSRPYDPERFAHLPPPGNTQSASWPSTVPSSAKSLKVKPVTHQQTPYSQANNYKLERREYSVQRQATPRYLTENIGLPRTTREQIPFHQSLPQDYWVPHTRTYSDQQPIQNMYDSPRPRHHNGWTPEPISQRHWNDSRPTAIQNHAATTHFSLWEIPSDVPYNDAKLNDHYAEQQYHPGFRYDHVPPLQANLPSRRPEAQGAPSRRSFPYHTPASADPNFGYAVDVCRSKYVQELKQRRLEELRYRSLIHSSPPSPQNHQQDEPKYSSARQATPQAYNLERPRPALPSEEPYFDPKNPFLVAPAVMAPHQQQGSSRPEYNPYATPSQASQVAHLQAQALPYLPSTSHRQPFIPLALSKPMRRVNDWSSDTGSRW